MTLSDRIELQTRARGSHAGTREDGGGVMAEYGVKEATIYARVRKYGWDHTRAVSVRPKSKLKRVRVQKRTT